MAVMAPAGFTLTEVVSGQSPPAPSLPPLLGDVEDFAATLKPHFQFHTGHQWLGELSSMNSHLNCTGKTGSLCQGAQVVNGPRSSGTHVGMGIYLKVVCLQGIEAVVSFNNILLLLSRAF